MKVIENEVKTPSRQGLRAGRYELLTRLAAGGMGEVFVARQTSAGAFEKRMALKLLLPHLSQEEEFVHMFLDEARIAARMNHPNIVHIFDLGVAEGRYFIAMALVEGTSLSRLLAACRVKGEPLTLPVVRLIASGLCTGLSYAHELKGPSGENLSIVHRDVNPSNCLVSVAGAVLLTDFGIAKAQDNLHRTRPGDVKGKYAYMAPEQMTVGHGVDPRADLFALGATLFEALTLTSPFGRGSEPETIDAVRHHAPPDAKALRPDLSAGMASALELSLRKVPEERIASARELRDLLMDGPVASPHELGALVERLCAKEVGAFRGAAPAPFQEVGTRSLVEPLPAAAGGSKKGPPPAAAGAPPALGDEAPAPTRAMPRTPSGVRPPKPREEPRGEAREAAPAVEPPLERRKARVSSRRSAMAYGFLVGLLIVFTFVGVRVLLVKRRAAAAPAPVVTAPLPALPGAAPPAVPGEAPAEAPGNEATAAEEPEPAGDPQPAHPGAPVRHRPARRSRAGEEKRDEPVRVGYLSADATPWAAIYIEGQQVDRTPLSRYPLPAGEHWLVFKNPESGKEAKRRVTIEEGKVATLRVDLTQ